MFNQRRCLFGLLAFIVCSCAAGPRSPYKANTFEVLVGDNVQRYLADRQMKLRALRSRAATLDDDILQNLGRLHDLERQLKNVRDQAYLSDRDLAALRMEVAEQKNRAHAAFETVLSIANQVKETEVDIQTAQEDRERDEKRISSLRESIDVLEQKNIVLEQAIKRSLNLKAEQLLRERSRQR